MNKKKRGYFFGSYDVVLAEYSGVDFSKLCFIFPGQGGAYPGMCASEYALFPQLREKFVLADTLAKKHELPAISSYVLAPETLPEEILPRVANLALFTIEITFFEMLIAQGKTPALLTGHSFGEYATMVAAGVFSFEDMFEIVYRRDFFCPMPNTLGYLVALQSDEKTAKKFIGPSDYYVSNINSPTQTVISIPPHEKDAVDTRLTDAGIRHKVLLNIPQPYHSPFLSSVRNRITEYCYEADTLSLFHPDRMHRPFIPFYSSVLHKVIDTDHFSRDDILSIIINQITEPVDFIRQIRAIEKKGVSRFVEIGPKKVFAKFAEDILNADKREVKTQIAIDLLLKQEQTIADNHTYDEKTLEVVRTTIAKHMGYASSKIIPQSRFQNDLGIDSIKKADIILTVLDALQMRPGDTFNASKFERVSDVLLYIEQGGQGTKTNHVRKAVFERYSETYREASLDTQAASSDIKKSLHLKLTDIVLHTEAVKQSVTTFFSKKSEYPVLFIEADDQEKNLPNIFLFFKDLAPLFSDRAFSLILLSQGNGDESGIEALGAFFKSLKKELPKSFFKHIHTDTSLVQKILDQEATLHTDIEVKYEDGKRFVRCMVRADLPKKEKFPSQSIIFAIGGARGITYELLKNIAKESKSVLYLAGRSTEEDEMIREHMSTLRKFGAYVEYICLNAQNKNELEEAYKKIIAKHGRIDLVIDAAGTMRVAFLADVSDKNLLEEYESKILPAAAVLGLAEKYKPKKTIIFSSIVSGYGSAGQTVYAAANAYIGKMTEVANKKLAAEGCSASVIHWPGWCGVGMTDDKGILQNLLDKGVSLIKPKRAAELFVSEVISKSGDAVFYMDALDDRSFSFALADMHEHSTLLGTLQDPFGLSITNQEFSRIFDLTKDHFLLDHKIKGVPYVPAAYGLSMFLCLGKLYTGSAISLSQIQIYNPIIVENKPVEATLEMKHTGKKHSFFLRTNRPCFSGVLDETKISPTQYQIPESVRIIDAAEIYATCGPHDPIFFGPFFQSLQALSFDGEGKAFAKIDASALKPVSGDKTHDKLILCIDAIFQTFGMSADFGKSAFVPVGVEKLSVFSQLHEKHFVYVLIEQAKLEGDSLFGDAVLVDEVGKTLVECKGISMSRVHFKK